jgi:hypothetical protein
MREWTRGRIEARRAGAWGQAADRVPSTGWVARLYAVVERPTKTPAFLGPYVGPPPWEPRSQFIALSAQSTDEEVLLVVAQLARYGHGGDESTSFEGLVAEFPRITPGGLAASDSETTVEPSCCCGLEMWRDWHQLRLDGSGPWLGHDPAPWVEKRGDEYLVWPDGGLDPVPMERLRPVCFSARELDEALTGVENDLKAFAERLRTWTDARAPQSAPALASAFRRLAQVG